MRRFNRHRDAFSNGTNTHPPELEFRKPRLREQEAVTVGLLVTGSQNKNEKGEETLKLIVSSNEEGEDAMMIPTPTYDEGVDLISYSQSAIFVKREASTAKNNAEAMSVDAAKEEGDVKGIFAEFKADDGR
ncbi:hypothetical protein R3P38DRAFT_3226818 [Favolaschia claudopus]|uniref:Uncharacterized protein n=1 Tax=Favolaschia claudopus TaxID=2862362 RepID=A0AAV9ZT37_9AGAR